MKIRFFGSPKCKNCLELYVILNKYQIDFEYIDAFDEKKEIQDICDFYNVEELPHIQFIDDKENILIEHIGEINANEFMKYMIDYFPQY